MFQRRHPSDEPRDPAKARRYAMDALARREYGAAELVNKMTKAGFEYPVAEDTVAELTAENLQNDERFCEAFVKSYARRGKGPLRVLNDLGDRGVAQRLIDAAMQETEVDWFERACEVREQKFGSDKPADFTEKARQMRFLQYRGFGNEHISVACNR